MDKPELLRRISQGRTDLVFDLLRLPDWRAALREGPIEAPQWFVYHDDVTALKAVLEAGGDLDMLDLDLQLNSAAFFGHWKVCDFLIGQGADVRSTVAATGETPLHGALCKAGRPHFVHVVRLLLEHGADPNAPTIPGAESDAFMRDVRCRGETPLHRAAAYGSPAMIGLLLEHGARRDARDANGDSPLTWASRHLRPRTILRLLTFGEHHVHPAPEGRESSDHGCGWGDGMEWNFLGEYLPESLDR